MSAPSWHQHTREGWEIEAHTYEHLIKNLGHYVSIPFTSAN